MGSFQHSKHELFFVFKTQTAGHANTVGLGDTGCYRTNVWGYVADLFSRKVPAWKRPETV